MVSSAATLLPGTLGPMTATCSECVAPLRETVYRIHDVVFGGQSARLTETTNYDCRLWQMAWVRGCALTHRTRIACSSRQLGCW